MIPIYHPVPPTCWGINRVIALETEFIELFNVKGDVIGVTKSVTARGIC